VPGIRSRSDGQRHDQQEPNELGRAAGDPEQRRPDPLTAPGVVDRSRRREQQQRLVVDSREEERAGEDQQEVDRAPGDAVSVLGSKQAVDVDHRAAERQVDDDQRRQDVAARQEGVEEPD
jgi:hypothetical protein